MPVWLWFSRLQALADQTTNKVMPMSLRTSATRVEGGDSFSEALQKHPKPLVGFMSAWSVLAKRVVCSPKSSLVLAVYLGKRGSPSQKG